MDKDGEVWFRSSPKIEWSKLSAECKKKLRDEKDRVDKKRDRFDEIIIPKALTKAEKTGKLTKKQLAELKKNRARKLKAYDELLAAMDVLRDKVFEIRPPAVCYCHDAKRLTKRPRGPERRFEVEADVVEGTENDENPKVCQVHRIRGPLIKTATRGNRTAQNKMIDFLLGGDSSVYEAGHIIGDTLGGPNKTWNLVPMLDAFNKGAGWKSMEDRNSPVPDRPSRPGSKLNQHGRHIDLSSEWREEVRTKEHYCDVDGERSQEESYRIH